MRILRVCVRAHGHPRKTNQKRCSARRQQVSLGVANASDCFFFCPLTGFSRCTMSMHRLRNQNNYFKKLEGSRWCRANPPTMGKRVWPVPWVALALPRAEMGGPGAAVGVGGEGLSCAPRMPRPARPPLCQTEETAGEVVQTCALRAGSLGAEAPGTVSTTGGYPAHTPQVRKQARTDGRWVWARHPRSRAGRGQWEREGDVPLVRAPPRLASGTGPCVYSTSPRYRAQQGPCAQKPEVQGG